MRHIATLAACALSAPAFATFVTLDIREDKAAPPPGIAAQIDPGGLGFRTFNFYAVFDGPGSTDNQDFNFLNRPLTVSTDEKGLSGTSFGIRKESLFGAGDFDFNENAFFYETPAPFGSDFRPNQGFIDLEPALEWDTYVGMGKKVVTDNNDAPVDGGFPGFDFPDRDGDGRPDSIAAGWGTGDPTNEGLLATFNTDSGQFEAFLAQITIVGLDSGAQLGQQVAPGIFNSQIFSGHFEIATQGTLFLDGGPPALFFAFEFIPSPSPMFAVMGFVGFASARRRRA